MQAGISLALVMAVMALLAPAPAQAQITVKVGADWAGTYHTSAMVVERVTRWGDQLVEMDLSHRVGPGTLVGIEMKDGDWWQAGIGLERLLPRSVDGHVGSFSFTGVYLLTGLRYKRPPTPFATIRFGWTLFHGDEAYHNPKFGAAPLRVLRSNAKVQLRSGYVSGVTAGIDRGRFRFEAAYTAYQGRRRVRENAQKEDEFTRITDMMTTYSRLSLLIGYTLGKRP